MRYIYTLEDLIIAKSIFFSDGKIVFQLISLLLLSRTTWESRRAVLH